jgi:hypothetical protein
MLIEKDLTGVSKTTDDGKPPTMSFESPKKRTHSTVMGASTAADKSPPKASFEPQKTYESDTQAALSTMVAELSSVNNMGTGFFNYDDDFDCFEFGKDILRDLEAPTDIDEDDEDNASEEGTGYLFYPVDDALMVEDEEEELEVEEEEEEASGITECEAGVFYFIFILFYI